MSADGKSNIYQAFLKAYLHPFRNIAWGKKSTVWAVVEAIGNGTLNEEFNANKNHHPDNISTKSKGKILTLKCYQKSG